MLSLSSIPTAPAPSGAWARGAGGAGGEASCATPVAADLTDLALATDLLDFTLATLTAAERSSANDISRFVPMDLMDLTLETLVATDTSSLGMLPNLMLPVRLRILLPSSPSPPSSPCDSAPGSKRVIDRKPTGFRVLVLDIGKLAA
jgi:hypothetical protein